MFVKEEYIRSALLLHGIAFEGVKYIPIGVMTDKFAFIYKGKEYIARCYPKEREYLALSEYQYMLEFQKRGILCPKPVRVINVEQYQCLIYERLKGQMLSDKYETMNGDVKDKICREIASNYKRISDIPCSGFGRMLGYNKFSYSKICDMIDEIERDAEGWIIRYGSMNPLAKNVKDRFSSYSKYINNTQPMLVWSDLSMDNIIVNTSGRLVGFIDFEGLMGADVNLGIGYLQAHESNADFVERLIRMMPELDKRKIVFYAFMRYLRILPHTHLLMPNGAKRDNLNEFLPYVRRNL